MHLQFQIKAILAARAKMDTGIKLKPVHNTELLLQLVLSEGPAQALSSCCIVSAVLHEFLLVSFLNFAKAMA